VTPGEAQRALLDHSAEIDQRSIVDSWRDTLPDHHILHDGLLPKIRPENLDAAVSVEELYSLLADDL
jgi:hypothetical protein